MAGWLLDSGCTDHMSFQRGDFKELDLFSGGEVLGAGGEGLKIAGKGEVELKLSEGQTLLLRNVLYVPSLTQRLVSVSCLQADAISCLFFGNTNYTCCEIRKYNLLLATIPKTGNLWILHGSEAPYIPRASRAVTLQELHHKLGHPDHKKLLSMLDTGQLGEVELLGGRSVDNCYGCLVGKQARVSHPLKSNPITSAPLELIHTDLMGPITPASAGGAAYILTIIDDFTHFASAFLLRNKTQVAETWRGWWKQAEKQSGFLVKRIRCDKGTEFKNQKMDALVKEMGVKWEFTNTDTPQQNGVAERYNRTLISTVRAMMSSANCALKWWGEAVKTANYLRNRVPHAALPEGETPYYKWSGRLINPTRLHIFGCKAYVMNLKKNMTKLQTRANEGFFMGYSEDTAGYRVKLHSGKIVESSDVVFLDDTILKRELSHFEEREKVVSHLFPMLPSALDHVIPPLTPTPTEQTPPLLDEPLDSDDEDDLDSHNTLPSIPPVLSTKKTSSVIAEGKEQVIVAEGEEGGKDKALEISIHELEYMSARE